MKKIFITGNTGFIGTNLTNRLNELHPSVEIYGVNSRTSIDKINEYTKDCDFVFNFAAVHRPINTEDFDKINAKLFLYVIKCLENNNNHCPVLYTSSIQANDNSEYGQSKIHGEKILKEHTEKFKSRGIVYRLTNTFGPYARPNGHSVVANFCHNIAKGVPITISDPEHIMHLQYVDDVISDFLKRISEGAHGTYEFYEISPKYIYDITLEKLAEYLYSFENDFKSNKKPICKTEFEKKLLKTYIYYRKYYKE